MSKKKQRTVGFAFTGSFCTYEKIKEVVRQLVKEDNRVIPIFSQTAQTVNCRFGDARDFIIEIQEITGERGIFSIQEAEPIGPKGLLDILVIAPCTGNTMAKLAAGITDTPVLMAAKAHMRNDKPVVLSPATNDALGASLKNIGFLMIIYTAGLQTIPKDVMESAELDGCSGLKKVLKIELPLLMPTVTINLFVSISGAFKSFDIPNAMTGGGPYGSTMPVAMNIYQEAFTKYNLGYGSAKSVILFLTVAAVTLIQLYCTRKKEVEY